GALEHSYCSFYFLPEYDDYNQLKEIISSVAAHEFLHILTPLNIHSKEIENFDFRNPKMSKHLWLYEGVTEYFSYLIQIQSGLMDYSTFLDEWRGKIVSDLAYKPISFTVMSERIVEPKYQKMYLNVYAKGALIGLMLDLRLNELSGGKQSLKSVMMALSQKYGPSKPFDDDQFIQEITAMTYPEIGTFFQKYVIGDAPLPYKEYLEKIGWEYLPEANVKVYNYGKVAIGYDPELEIFYVRYAKENVFGLREDDILKKVNGQTLTLANAERLLIDFQNAESPAEITIHFQRSDTDMEVSAKPQVLLQKQKHVLREIPNISVNQTQLRVMLFGLNAFPKQ
ncbi:MAG: peptidase M61, partial [Flammeovirgaceae bacterium]